MTRKKKQTDYVISKSMVTRSSASLIDKDPLIMGTLMEKSSLPPSPSDKDDNVVDPLGDATLSKERDTYGILTYHYFTGKCTGSIIGSFGVPGRTHMEIQLIIKNQEMVECRVKNN